MKYRMLFLLSLDGIAQLNNSVRDLGWAISVKKASFKNLYPLNDTIYRSEQPKQRYTEDLKKPGIRSVFDLRAQHNDSHSLKDTSFIYFNIEFVIAPCLAHPQFKIACL
jgi:tyrosine-protein phosphatase SIW14